MQNTLDTTKETTLNPGHGSQSGVSVTMPNYDGQVGVKNNAVEAFGIGAMTLGTPLGTSSGGLGQDFSDSGGTGYALFKESATSGFSLRAITSTDISPMTRLNILDSLSKQGTADPGGDTISFKRPIEVIDSNIIFYQGTTARGKIQASASGMVMSAHSASTVGITVLDNNSAAYLKISGGENGGLFITAPAQNNDHFEIQHRGQTTVRTDSTFQVTDSTAKAVFQVSNWGDVGLSPKATGVNTFTTTATADTVLITGAASTDRYTWDYTQAPNANDVMKWYTAKTDTVIFSRAASGTSGIGYTWFRFRVLP
jgi:hypothetical protein